MEIKLCDLTSLTPYEGRAALIDGEAVAVFLIPNSDQQVYVIQNWDPIGQAYVLNRGIVGDIGGKICVASPLYKQHFELSTGECLENADAGIKTWPVNVVDGEVFTQIQERACA
ncbi:nitrite reductase small subunit NirD [Vibrio maerlii]|uniref:nitrite reductase small subunit NirD n=1 Tax=Vibrio maerlii TaxID=2231648 RepID=UPI000E3B9455|nr:nitrite reductase small subunit NirD [Vibrio maerlii]